MSQFRETRSLARESTRFFVAAVLTLIVAAATAGPREQARRIHDRIAGVPPTESVLADMAAEIRDNSDPQAAADIAMENRHFYDVTIKNMAMPWTNEAQTAFAPLNDYVATVIGLIRDDADFRRVLYDDVVYVGNGSFPPYSTTDNDHYEALEEANADLAAVLEPRLQSNLNPELSPDATAGVMTTRQAAKAFFKDGTNRAMFRFTLMNHLCRDLEQVKDISLPPDRIRQDVSRSPGGDSRIYQNSCVGCHTGMDPMAQAFAYYEYEYADEDGENGRLIYNQEGETDPETGSRVTAKHRINAETFPYGYVVTDDQWDNYWRQGKNRVLGWDFAPVDGVSGSGSGMKSLGKELAGSRAFAECQVKKVFRTVCLRRPASTDDHDRIDQMVTSLSNSNFQLKQTFAEAAAYCSTDVE